MKRTLGLAAMLAPLLFGGAAAGYDVGSELSSEAPIDLSGRVDVLARAGLAVFLAGDDVPEVTLTLTAEEAHVDHWTVEPGSCPTFPPGVPCAQPSGGASSEETVLRGATFRVTNALSAYKVLATNHPDHKDHYDFGTGAMLAKAGGRTSIAASAKDAALTAYEWGWREGAVSAGSSGEPVYAIPKETPTFAVAGGATLANLEATGNFEVFLQGVEVVVEDADGGRRTFETSAPRNGRLSFLVIEVRGGTLHATSEAPLTLAHVDGVDVPSPGTATFRSPSGKVVVDGRTTEYGGDGDVPLPGPLALKELAVEPGSDPLRIAFTLSSDLFLQEEVRPEEDEPTDVQALAVAGAMGAGGAGALAGLLYFWPRLRYAATLLFLPLYTRIERTDVLNHEKRDEIYELIRATPGIHAHEIGERTRIGWGTTVYHLKMLEGHSLVVSKKSGRYKRFYVNTGEYTHKKDAYAALRNATAKSVAQFIVEHPGCSQKELCAALGIQPSLASWHVEKLEGVQLVKRVKDGRQVRYYAGPAWSDLNVRMGPAGAEGVAET